MDIKDIVEGIHRQKGREIAVYNASKGLDINLNPVLQRWIVVEVFFDPFVFDQQKLVQLVNKYGDKRILNLEKAINFELPRNTILAQKITDQTKGNIIGENSLMFLYPFFPSSLSLPCKPGEHVWVLFEHLTTFDNIGYWICSIVGPGHVDDVNHTHFPRIDDVTFETRIVTDTTITVNSHEDTNFKPRYHFKNGSYLYQDPGVYERILSESEAVKASVYEPIPRFRKRPGDIAIEGSNNTLIVLGRDRTGSAVTYTNYDDISDPQNPIQEGPKSVSTDDLTFKKKSAGSIDIVAGRGQSPSTSGNSVINDLQNIELAKNKKSISLGEGDPDFKNDRSRIYVSQNTQVDSNLEISSHNSSKLGISDSQNGDAGIIIKSDKIRIFARSDVQILVTGFTEETRSQTISSVPDGLEQIQDQLSKTYENTIKTQKDQDTNWASITIKSNGDIVFKPSEKGYIRLGDDSADRALLCTDSPAVLQEKGVSPATPPLSNTMGGRFGGTGIPTQGTWASKVLVTGAK